MPGDSPGEAVRNFLAPIKDAIAVLGDGVLVHSAHPQIGERQAVVLCHDGRGIRVESSVYGTLRLSVGLNYEVVLCEDGDPRGPYRCSTRSYIHAIYDGDDKLLLGFHWHPDSTSPDRQPHMHVGSTRIQQSGELHIPTPRVSVEEVVTLAIDSLGARPTVDEETWRGLLDASRATHEKYREWHHRADAPTEFD